MQTIVYSMLTRQQTNKQNNMEQINKQLYTNKYREYMLKNDVTHYASLKHNVLMNSFDCFNIFCR